MQPWAHLLVGSELVAMEGNVTNLIFTFNSTAQNPRFMRSANHLVISPAPEYLQPNVSMPSISKIEPAYRKRHREASIVFVAYVTSEVAL